MKQMLQGAKVSVNMRYWEWKLQGMQTPGSSQKLLLQSGIGTVTLRAEMDWE